MRIILLFLLSIAAASAAKPSPCEGEWYVQNGSQVLFCFESELISVNEFEYKTADALSAVLERAGFTPPGVQRPADLTDVGCYVLGYDTDGWFTTCDVGTVGQ